MNHTFTGQMGFLRRRPFYASAVVLIVILGGMLIQVSSLPFFEPDESRYVEVSREMLETGEYVIPQLNYETRLNKPALYHWILAAGFRILGLSRFSARILSILAAMGVLLLTARFAWKHLGREAEAPLSVAVLGTSALFWWMSRIAMVDIFLNLCIIAALFLLYDWERNRSRQSLLWMAGFAIALGVNLKGPVAFALPAIIFLTYVALLGELKSVWRGAPWIRWFVVVLFLSLPWYVLATWKMGSEAGRYFFVDELFARFLTNKFHRRRPLYLFLLMVPLVVFPWPLIAFRAVWNQRINFRSQGFRYWVRNSSARAYLLIWSAATVVFFSLCKSKMVHYLIPLTPALALLTADWLNLWSTRRKRILTWLIPYTLIGFTGASILWLHFQFEPAQSGIPLLAVCVLLGSVYAVYISLIRFTGSFAHLLGFILLPVLFYQLAIVGFNLDREIWPSNIDFAQFAKEWATPETQVYSLYEPKPCMLSQLERRIETINSGDAIAGLLDSPKPSLLLSTKSSLNAFVQAELKQRSSEIWANYVPFEKYGLLFNRAYADAFFPQSPSIPLDRKGDVRLIAIGDPGGYGREPFELERLLECVEPSPDAVLLLGDNVYLHPTRKYDRIDTAFESPFKPLLERGVPFYAVLGNKDQEIAERITHYPKFHMDGKRYYTKTFGDGLVDCFFLDCEDAGASRFSEKSPQVDWFVRSLERSKAPWKIAVIHHPVRSCCREGEECSLLGERLSSISEFHRIPVVLSGHCHCYNRIQDKFHSTQFVVGNGAGASNPIVEPIHGVGYTQSPVFLVLDVFQDEIIATAICLQGEIVDRTELPLPRALTMTGDAFFSK